jgi:DNA-directed RNA polymerase subunit RPC12/RpoP
MTDEQILNAKETASGVTKCPSCGANLEYDPAARGLKCPYCGTVVALDFTKISEEQVFSKLFDKNTNDWGAETHVVRCANCGAREIISKMEITKRCAFCGTTNVVDTDEVSGLKPNAVLPFLLTEKAACENVVKWAKNKFFAPRKFKKSVKPEDVYGNYSPSFTFDADTFSSYDGELGEYYYVTVRVNGKDVRERRTRWFHISGNHSFSFDDVLIQASQSMTQKTLNKLQPFDTNRSQDYSEDFLEGFSASQYTKDGKQCWSEAQGIMKKAVEKQILSGYRYDVIRYINVDMKCRNVTYKYVLLPLYVGHCSYSQKLYNFFVNGQNGKVAGKTPVSWIKILIVALIALAAIAGLVYLFISEGGNP